MAKNTGAGGDADFKIKLDANLTDVINQIKEAAKALRDLDAAIAESGRKASQAASSVKSSATSSTSAYRSAVQLPPGTRRNAAGDVLKTDAAIQEMYLTGTSPATKARNAAARKSMDEASVIYAQNASAEKVTAERISRKKKESVKLQEAVIDSEIASVKQTGRVKPASADAAAKKAAQEEERTRITNARQLAREANAIRKADLSDEKDILKTRIQSRKAQAAQEQRELASGINSSKRLGTISAMGNRFSAINPEEMFLNGAGAILPQAGVEAAMLERTRASSGNPMLANMSEIQRYNRANKATQAAIMNDAAIKNAQGDVLRTQLGRTTRPLFQEDIDKERQKMDRYYSNDQGTKDWTMRGNAEWKQRQKVEGLESGVTPGVQTIDTAFKRALVWGAVSTAIYKSIGAAQTFISEMIKMDTELAQLKKTLGGTNEDFNKLMNNAIEIAREYKAPVKDVLDAMELFSQQFKRGADIELLSKAAITFSNISGQTVNESAKTLTAAIQQYGLSVSDAIHLTDSWSAVAANTTATTKDLGDAFGQVGGAAKTVGLTVDQLNALIGTISSATGKSGQEIGSALKRTFERYTAPENAKELNKLGIYVKDAEHNYRNFMDVLGDVEKKWDTLSQTEKKQIAIAFSGARQYDSFLAIMNHFSEVQKTLTTSQDSFGAAALQNSFIVDTVAKKITRLGNEFDALARGTKGDVLPAMGATLDVVTKILETFNRMPSTIQNITKLVATVSAASFALSWGLRTALTVVNNRGDRVPTGGKNSLAGNIMEASGGGSFNIAKAIGRKVGGSELGALSGLGSLTSGAGIGATITSVAIGIAAISAAFIALAAIAWAVVKGWDAVRFKGLDIASQAQESLMKNTQKIAGLDQFKGRLDDAARERATLEKKGVTQEARDKFDKGLSSGLLSDINRNNPELLSEKVAFNIHGEALDINAKKLRELAKSTGEATENAKKLAEAEANASNVLLAKEIASGANGQETVKSYFFKLVGLASSELAGGILSNFFKQGGAGPKDLGNIITAARSTGQTISKDMGQPSIDVLVKSMTSNGVKINSDEIKGNIEILTSIMALSNTAQKQVNEALSKVKSTSKNKGKKLNEEYDGVIAGYWMAQLQQIDPDHKLNTKQLGIVNLAKPTRKVFEDALKNGSLGVPESSSKFKQFIPSPVNRIDLELMKSLENNSRLFDLFGSRVNYVSTALGAYKQALTDLATSTDKAAGPLEEQQFIKRQERIAKLKEQISYYQNPAKARDNQMAEQSSFNEEELGLLSKKYDYDQNSIKSGDQKAAKLADILAQEEKINQAVVKQSEEGERYKKILLEQYEKLQLISDLQDVLKSPLNTALTSILPNNRERLATTSQLEEDKRYAQSQLSQEMQRQAIDGTANTAGGRNALKHIREQIDGINRQIDDTNSKTNVWNQLLKNIGDQALGKISSRLVDMGLEEVGKLAAGGAGDSGFMSKVFGGGSNPILDKQTMALDTNTAALQILTATIAGKSISETGGTLVGSFLKNQIGIEGLGASLEDSLGGAGLSFGSKLPSLVGYTAGLGAAGLALGASQTSLESVGGLTGSSMTGSNYSFGNQQPSLVGSQSSIFSGSNNYGPSPQIAKGAGAFGTNTAWGSVGMAALAGAGAGYSITQGMNKTGFGGTIGGAIGAGVGAFAGPFGSAVGGILGGLLGSVFDQDVKPISRSLDELDMTQKDIAAQLIKLDKSINTINDTMENIINAPSNFTLPIPKGILENSITAQSAIATPLQAGGLILRSGPAYLHAGETVNRANSNDTGSMVMHNEININGANSNPEEIAQEVMRKLNSSYFTQSQRSGNYQSRF